MHWNRKYSIFFFVSLLSALIAWGIYSNLTRDTNSPNPNLAYSNLSPQIIKLDLPSKRGKAGGIIATDVNNDGQQDFIVTMPNYIAAYDSSGEKLWIKKINIQITEGTKLGLPGLHGPGVQAADVDKDQQNEVLFLTKDNTLHIVQGDNGEQKQSIKLESPIGTERWEHLVIGNFRGEGDQDLLLQGTEIGKSQVGPYLAAYSLKDLMDSKRPAPLWERDDFHSSHHSGVRIADIDGDGKDEILGGMIISPDGEILVSLPMERSITRPHADSIFVADVLPDLSGLEVVALEEGFNKHPPGNNPLSKALNKLMKYIPGIDFRKGNRIFLYNADGLIWESHHKHQEPQNAAIGDFIPNQPGLEIWCRSRYDTHQEPFVFNAKGKYITEYEMNNVTPQNWTLKGVEEISPINWTGRPKQLAVSKERHKSGDVSIFDPISGEFLYRFREKTDRLYVADVSGDWREEIIILNGNQLHIYQNPALNPRPEQPRLWDQAHYRRSKMTWNYYNP